jgi:hypothetical protein
LEFNSKFDSLIADGMPRKHFSKWLAVTLACIALFLLAIGMLRSVLLPRWLEKEIRQALGERGLKEVSLSFDGLGLHQTSLKNVRIGRGDSLSIGEIAVTYDPESLQQRRVQAIDIKHAYLAIAIKNGRLDLGPLAGYTSAGPVILPFDVLKLSECELRVDWEGLILSMPMAAEITPLTADSVDIDLHADVQEGNLHLHSSVSMVSLQGAGTISLLNIDAGILKNLQRLYFPGYALNPSGHWGGEASFRLEGASWLARGLVNGDSLRAGYLPAGMNQPVVIERLRTNFDLHSDSLSTLTLHSLINQIAATLTATFDLKTRKVSGEFAAPNLELEALQPLLNDLTLPVALHADGRLAISGNYSISDRQRGWAQVSLRGQRLSAQAHSPSFHLKLQPLTLNLDARLASSKQKTTLTNAKVQMQGTHIAEDNLGMALSDVGMNLPVDWQKQSISHGDFSIGKARWREFELSALAGDLRWENQRWFFSSSASLLESARLGLSGWLDHSQEKIAGELALQVPAFTLQNSAALTPFFPKLHDHPISGDFALTGHLQVKQDNFVPYIRLETQNVAWQSRLTEARVDGISGTLEINGLEPLTSAGEQHFSFASASFGDLNVTDGDVLLTVASQDSFLIKSLSCSWAGGKLASRNLLLQPSTEQIHFVLRAEALDLQAILDFIQYQGVKGQGKIYGELPITLHWGDKKRLSFGDGYLEARPQAGVLQLSPENAQALLGVRKPIDPKNASLEDQVSLMVINALQDMAYTNLRIEFKNEPNRGLMTYVRVQGYGPRDEMEKQIPIGGFNVNINHLDDLLNSMIWPHLSAGRVKLE